MVWLQAPCFIRRIGFAAQLPTMHPQTTTDLLSSFLLTSLGWTPSIQATAASALHTRRLVSTSRAPRRLSACQSCTWQKQYKTGQKQKQQASGEGLFAAHVTELFRWQSANTRRMTAARYTALQSYQPLPET